MTNDASTHQSPINESAQSNELTDIMFLRLYFCTSESQPTSYCQFSGEKSMVVEQIMAAAEIGSFSHRCQEIQPKRTPMEFNAWQP